MTMAPLAVRRGTGSLYHLEIFELRPGYEGYDRGHRHRLQHRGEWAPKSTSWVVHEGADPIFALRRARAFVESCPGRSAR